jgi:glutaryl-CoA dehydrogenase
LLSEDERAIRDTVRDYCAAELAPHIMQWFESGDLPAREIARGLGELGVLGMHLDGYGTAGTNAVSYGLACMELEAIDSGIRSLVSVQGSLAMFAIWKHGSDEQREQWLPGMARGELLGCFGLTEPDHGSNPSGMRTTARRDGASANADWILSGTKMWITNGGIADVAIVWAQTDEGIRGFVVPTSAAGFTANPVGHKLSLRASVTSELVLDNVRLPADAVLPEVRGLGGPLSCLSEARFGIVFGALGAARDCLDCAIDYSVTRTQFDRPLAGFQLTQAKLADMTLELQKGYLLALHIGRMKDAGSSTPQMISVGKLNNVRESLEIARTSRTILGGNGITLEYPVLRHANNLESVLTYEGTSEIHTLVIGEAVTGVSAFR